MRGLHDGEPCQLDGGTIYDGLLLSPRSFNVEIIISSISEIQLQPQILLFQSSIFSTPSYSECVSSTPVLMVTLTDTADVSSRKFTILLVESLTAMDTTEIEHHIRLSQEHPPPGARAIAIPAACQSTYITESPQDAMFDPAGQRLPRPWRCKTRWHHSGG